MSDVIVIPNELQPLAQAALSPTPKTAAALSDSKKRQASLKLALVQPVIDLVNTGVKVRAAAALVWARYQAGEMSSDFCAAVTTKKKVSAASLERWARAMDAKGFTALAPKHCRPRAIRGWETRAAALYRKPGKPYHSTVAFWLRNEGHTSATDWRVRRYLQSLPSDQTETSPQRVGRHYYNQNIRPHKVRDSGVVPVGFVYTADGHCFKAIVGHPETGNPWRPEVTVWLDVRSSKVVSWWVSESESANTTLFSLSQALVGHNHVPAYIHVDPGSGFKALLLTDEVSGFLARFDIQPIFTLPGNARGKGLIEGFWRWMKERCATRFATYCGDDRTDDALSRLRDKIRRGETVLPSYEQFLDELRDYFEAYDSEPKDSLDGKSPNEVWADLERVSLEMPAAAVIRPRVVRTVKRWGVVHQKRRYQSKDLEAHEGREVMLEYSLHDDGRAWIQDLKGRFICEAPLVEKIPWLPASRIEEGQQRRLAGQQKRLQARMDESVARSRGAITSTPAAVLGVEPHDSGESLQRLTHELVDEQARQDDDETPEQRFSRALALEAAAPNGRSAADARWLEQYQLSSEYHSRRGLMEE